jgi:hypothetical protein
LWKLNRLIVKAVLKVGKNLAMSKSMPTFALSK